MATDTLRDQLYLQELFQNALSPISNYGQGLLQLAVAKRTREMQLEDEARKTAERRAEAETERAFTRERDTAQQQFTRERDVAQQNFQAQQSQQSREFQLRLQEAAERAGMDRLMFQWDVADQKERENILRNMRASAAEVGAEIPDAKLSFDEQFKQLSSGISKAETQGVMNLMQGLAQDEAALSKITGSRPEERDKLAVEILLADAEATKALRPEEKMKLMSDPKMVIPILNRLAADKSKKGVEAFNSFVEAQQKSKATADEVFMKRTANRADAELIRGRLAERRVILSDKLKGKRFPADVYTNMFSAVNDEVGKIQQEQAPRMPPLPPRPQELYWPEGTPAGTAAPTAPGQWQGLVPLLQQATGGMTPGQMVVNPQAAATRALATAAAPGVREIGQTIASDPGVQGMGRILGAPFSAARYGLFGGAPPVGATPEDLAIRSPATAFRQILDRITRARLRTNANDQAAAQNALAPTAFPTGPTLTGAP